MESRVLHTLLLQLHNSGKFALKLASGGTFVHAWVINIYNFNKETVIYLVCFHKLQYA